MATTPNYDQIHQLMAADKKAEARQALKSILFRNSKDPHAWWLYAQVAEDKQQLYHILEALVELPINPYTARARAMLNSMPYQPSRKKVQSPPRARRENSSWITLAACVLTVLAVMLGAAIIIVVSPRAGSAAAGQPTAVLELATQAPQPTKTPVPTATLIPTSTPRPRVVWVLPSATPSPTPVDIAKALPPLNQFLLDHRSALDMSAADLAKALAESDQISIDTLEAAKTEAARIRKLRNEVTLLNTSAVPADVRLQVVFPAHVAYTDYANSVLQWMDLQIQAYQTYTDIAQAKTDDVAAVRKRWTQQTALASKQADLVKLKRAALDKALNAYNAYTARMMVTEQLSGQASIFDSTFDGQEQTVVRLSGGKYRVVYRIAPVDGSKPALTLVPRDGAGPKMQLIGGSKVDTSGNQSLELAAGYYTVVAESLNWWVVAFDPQ